MQRREFLELLSIAALAGAGLRPGTSEAQAASELYDVKPFGNVSLLHITDTHAQLLPVYFREPFGQEFLQKHKIKSGTPLAHALANPDFEALARRYGKMGGFAHIATLVKRLRAARPHALLLDGGDSWQGSATALWTRGADMMGAQQRLGVDYMTAHWEFTYGQKPDPRLPGQAARAERAHGRFRGPGVRAVCAAQRERRGARDHRPGVPVHADRQPAALRARLDASGYRKVGCKRSWMRCAPREPRR